MNTVTEDNLKDTVLRGQTERSTHCMLLTGPVQRSLLLLACGLQKYNKKDKYNL